MRFVKSCNTASLVMAAVVAVTVTGCSAASNGAAVKGAEETVREFYSLMGRGECAAALKLRPNYTNGSRRCEQFNDEHIASIKYLGGKDGRAFVGVKMTYKMGTQAAKTDGCAILVHGQTGWVIDGYEESANCTHALTALPAPAGHKATEQEIALSQKSQPAGAAKPPSPNGGAAAKPSGIEPRPGAERVADPLQVLVRYYEALDSGNCALVEEIRPGYTKCGEMERARLNAGPELVIEEPDIGVAVVSFKVSYVQRSRDGVTAASLDALAWLERSGASWTIKEVVGKDHTDIFNARLLVLQQQAVSAEGAAEPRQAQSNPSLELLGRCWNSGAISNRAGEKKIRDGLPPDSSGPPPDYIELAKFSRKPLPPNLRDSIRAVTLADPKAKMVALTFDLCEQADEQTGYDGEIVDYLRDQGVRATFYAGGKWMRSHPERAKQLMLDPLFEVGNHAWTHGNMRVLKGAEMEEQIVWTQAQYLQLRDELLDQCSGKVDAEILGRIPATPATFRFPYGTCSRESLDALAANGLAAVQWNIVTADPWSKQTAQGITKTILRGVKEGRGAIAVMHANGRGWKTAAALKQAVPQLRRKGYRFVTVSEMLEQGKPVSVQECYEIKPGDNKKYDKIFGKGTGEGG